MARPCTQVGFEGFGHVPGQPDNRGLLDIIASLQWVKENIAGFGGNPARITVAGHSAGAGAIMCLLCMPSAQGSFHRAILHSPTAFTVTPSAALRYSCPPLMSCIRASFAANSVLQMPRCKVAGEIPTTMKLDAWGRLRLLGSGQSPCMNIYTIRLRRKGPSSMHWRPQEPSHVVKHILACTGREHEAADIEICSLPLKANFAADMTSQLDF